MQIFRQLYCIFVIHKNRAPPISREPLTNKQCEQHICIAKVATFPECCK